MTQVRITETPWRAPGDPSNDRTLEFIISTAARDSHHTILNQNQWDLTRYQRNGIVGYQHAVWGAALCNDPNPDMVIGPGKAYSEIVPQQNSAEDASDGLRFDTDPVELGTLADEDQRTSRKPRQLVGVWKAEPRDINELADKIFRKVMFGTLKATSVGFKPVGEGQWGQGEQAKGMPQETFYFDGQELMEWSVVNMGSNPETVKRELQGQTRAAIAYVKARIPELSTRDVLRMTVKDVLDALEGDPAAAPFTDVTRAEMRETVPEFAGELHLKHAQLTEVAESRIAAARAIRNLEL